MGDRATVRVILAVAGAMMACGAASAQDGGGERPRGRFDGARRFSIGLGANMHGRALRNQRDPVGTTSGGATSLGYDLGPGRSPNQVTAIYLDRVGGVSNGWMLERRQAVGVGYLYRTYITVSRHASPRVRLFSTYGAGLYYHQHHFRSGDDVMGFRDEPAIRRVSPGARLAGGLEWRGGSFVEATLTGIPGAQSLSQSLAVRVGFRR